MKKSVLLLLLIATVQACFCQQAAEPGYKKTVEMKKTKDKRTANGHLLITAEVIEKARTDTKGRVIPGMDLYVRRSVQDYFIKFCESAVTSEVIKKELDKIKLSIKSLSMEAEIRSGIWDTCDGKEMAQCRTGTYIVIHNLIVK